MIYRVRRYVRGRMVRDYGAFECRGLAEYVAQRASEAHMGEAGYVAVEPEEA